MTRVMQVTEADSQEFYGKLVKERLADMPMYEAALERRPGTGSKFEEAYGKAVKAVEMLINGPYQRKEVDKDTYDAQVASQRRTTTYVNARRLIELAIMLTNSEEFDKNLYRQLLGMLEQHLSFYSCPVKDVDYLFGVSKSKATDIKKEMVRLGITRELGKKTHHRMKPVPVGISKRYKRWNLILFQLLLQTPDLAAIRAGKVITPEHLDTDRIYSILTDLVNGGLFNLRDLLHNGIRDTYLLCLEAKQNPKYGTVTLPVDPCVPVRTVVLGHYLRDVLKNLDFSKESRRLYLGTVSHEYSKEIVILPNNFFNIIRPSLRMIQQNGPPTIANLLKIGKNPEEVARFRKSLYAIRG